MFLDLLPAVTTILLIIQLVFWEDLFPSIENNRILYYALTQNFNTDWEFPLYTVNDFQILMQIGIRSYLSSRVELVDYLNGELSHNNHIWIQM